MKKYIKIIFKNILGTKCHKCKKGYIRYIGDELLSNTWISIYECDNCKEIFI